RHVLDHVQALGNGEVSTTSYRGNHMMLSFCALLSVSMTNWCVCVCVCVCVSARACVCVSHRRALLCRCVRCHRAAPPRRPPLSGLEQTASCLSSCADYSVWTHTHTPS